MATQKIGSGLSEKDLSENIPFGGQNFVLLELAGNNITWRGSRRPYKSHLDGIVFLVYMKPIIIPSTLLVFKARRCSHEHKSPFRLARL